MPSTSPTTPKRQEKRTGRRNPTKTRKKTTQAQAWEIVDSLLGKAHKVVDRELDPIQEVALIGPDGQVILDDDGCMVTMRIGGNSKVACWLIDKITSNTNGLLLRDIDAQLDTIDGVIQAAQAAVEHVFSRHMTLDDGLKVLNLLHQYCSLRAFDQIDELRTLVEQMEKQAGQTRVGANMDAKLLPQWGKLTGEPANKQPAE